MKLKIIAMRLPRFSFPRANDLAKPVELFSTQVQFKSEMVDAIRVRIPKAEQPAAEAAPMADDELNDEIPDW
jgi:hypothetical protein